MSKKTKNTEPTPRWEVDTIDAESAIMSILTRLQLIQERVRAMQYEAESIASDTKDLMLAMNEARVDFKRRKKTP